MYVLLLCRSGGISIGDGVTGWIVLQGAVNEIRLGTCHRKFAGPVMYEDAYYMSISQ